MTVLNPRPADSPATKTLYRLLRACAKRRIQYSMYEGRGVRDPIFVRFWPKDNSYRLLAIMPNGRLVQRAGPDDLGMSDPHATACLHRFFFEELEGARQARRDGDIASAFRRLASARKMRRAIVEAQRTAIETRMAEIAPRLAYVGTVERGFLIDNIVKLAARKRELEAA
jgi:hypothetical protein